MCSERQFGLTDMESMLTKIGLVVDKNRTSCRRILSLVTELVKGLLPIVSNDDVSSLVDFTCDSRCLHVYSTYNVIDYRGDFEKFHDFGDFSFTQFDDDARIERIEDIREECGYVGEAEGELDKTIYEEEEDKISFQGDSSNLDSTDSEVEKWSKKKKIIPPPNPPYKTTRKGRYSMLRV